MKLILKGNKYCKSTGLLILFFGLLLILGSSAQATSVNRMSLVNLEAKPGQVIKTEITLEGTDGGERTGYWYTNYKQIDGDDDKMDITSWITISPKDFTIKQGEKLNFTITVKVPRNATSGLWGATVKEAGQEGHSAERRTYVVFKDAPAGGNVYSGLLIPVSVKVSESADAAAGIINFILNNLLVIILSVVIIAMVVVQLILKKKKKPAVKR